MKKALIQTNFTAGEISPRLWAHVDVVKYKNAVKTATNCKILPHGPIARRNGFKYIAETKTSSQVSRLLKFQFSQSNAYVIEAGHQYFRFYKNGGQIFTGGGSSTAPFSSTFDSDISGWTDASTGTTVIWSSFAGGTMLVDSGIGTTARAYRLTSSLPAGPYSVTFTVVNTDCTINIGSTLHGTEFSTGLYAVGGPYTINFTSNATFDCYVEFVKGTPGASYIDNVSLNAYGVAITGSPYEVATPYSASELFDITYVQFGRKLYLFHPNHPIQQLVWTSDASWTIGDVVFRPVPTYESGTMPAATITPDATTGTAVNFTASVADSIIDNDVGREIQNLSGTGKATITSITSSTVCVAEITEAFSGTGAIASQSWKLDLSPIASITPSGAKLGSIITLTATGNTWKSSYVGMYVLIASGIVKITTYTSATVVSGQVQKPLTAITATTAWTLEDPVWTATNGYPAIGALFQERLWAASTALKLQTVWASENGIFDSMGAGVGDSDALDFNLSSKEISNVSWMANIRGQLALGTNSGEMTIGASSSSSSVTPSSIQQQVRGYHGANVQQALGLDDEVLYIQRSDVKINAFRYDFQIDNYVSEDLLFLAQGIASGGIKEIAYAQDPDRQIYAVLNNGYLLVCAYVREQEVVGWSRFTTTGNFESIQTISTGPNDEVWTIVNRTINGSTKRYVERLDIADGSGNLDGFSDCYLTYSSPKAITGITKANPGVVTATDHGFSDGDLVKIFDVGGMTEVEGITYKVANKTTNTFELNTSTDSTVDTSSFTTYTSEGNVYKLVSTISGLSHLEGCTVQIKADGAVHADKTVSSGAVTLDVPVYQATVGLSYTTTIVTLPKEFDVGLGTQQGQQMRFVHPVLRLYQSAQPTVNGIFVPARSPADLMDRAVPLYTGDVYYGNLDWTDGFSSTLVIQTDNPMPMTLLGIFGSVDGGEE